MNDQTFAIILAWAIIDLCAFIEVRTKK